MLSSIQPVSEQLSALRIPRTGSTVVPVCGQLTSHLAVHVANKQSTKRKTIENHIARGFNQAYQAQITEFMPLLVALGRSKIEAALGVRTGEHKLFVETYFDQPLEQTMAEKGIHCSRHRLAEIGNLYSRSSRFTMPLLLLTAMGLFQQHISLLVFTATSQLQRMMEHGGLTLHHLTDADEARLGEPKQNWGSYYQTAPKVVAARVADIIQLTLDNPKLRAGYEQFAPLVPAFSAELGAQL